MAQITVETPSRTYQVHVARGLLSSVGEICRDAAGGEVAFVVTDTNVGPLYADVVCASLVEAGYETHLMTVEAGEPTKCLSVLGTVLEEMASAGLTRGDVVVALGGGVVGDLAGFAGACYMRGCKVVQVPTSLLAMVDSSVGGKTAVDLTHGKNLAGAFLQPHAVIADLDCLTTVSADLFRDSCGEVIKYGVMADSDLFDNIQAHPIVSWPLDLNHIGRVVARCVEIKRDVVGADERERGLRQILNLGHTIGHAIEAESDYALGHGSCVAAGTCIVARAAARQGALTVEDASRIEALTAAYGLPTTTELPSEVVFSRALSDKKRHGSTINVVVPTRIGAVEVRTLALSDFRHLVEVGLPEL